MIQQPHPAQGRQLRGTTVKVGQPPEFEGGRGVVCQIAQPKKPRHAEFKGLISHAFLPPGERRT